MLTWFVWLIQGRSAIGPGLWSNPLKESRRNEEIKLDNKKGLLLFCSIVILSISVIIASKNIGDAVKDFGLSLSTLNSNDESYELIVEDDWLYLYEKKSGNVWRKGAEGDPTWGKVEHYTTE